MTADHPGTRRLTGNPKRGAATVLVKPWPSPRAEFVQNAVAGRMTPEDQAYMARALLQLSDENAELRERVSALEMVTRVLVGSVRSGAQNG